MQIFLEKNIYAWVTYSLLKERVIWLIETVTKQAWISFLIVSVILVFRTHDHDGVLADGIYYYSSWWIKSPFREMRKNSQ